MDAALKELAKLEKLTAAKGKSPSIAGSLDSLLLTLRETKQAFVNGTGDEEQLKRLSETAEAKKKEVDERQKEIYTVLARLGKALDKVRRVVPLYCVVGLTTDARNSQRRCLRIQNFLNQHHLVRH